MQQENIKPAVVPKMFCNLFGHNYEVTRKVTYHVKEYTCTNCKSQLTTSSSGRLVELTPKFKEINAILEHIHLSRIKRLKRKSVTSSIYQ